MWLPRGYHIIMVDMSKSFNVKIRGGLNVSNFKSKGIKIAGKYRGIKNANFVK
jgi:hypothetical protein